MVIQGPKVLNCVESYDRALIVFPIAIFIVLEEPQRPGILKLKRNVDKISYQDSKDYKMIYIDF